MLFRSDAFSFHPYLESSRLPPTFRHPLSTSISLNDYDKLVALLGQAFDGTAQPGTTLPVVYDEFGVQSRIGSRKVRHYTNRGAPAARDAVSEALQAAYYRRALELAACQPTVTGLLFFHVSDEHDMRAWQSGLYYADDGPKSSLQPTKLALDESRRGVVTHCDGLALTVKPTLVQRGAALTLTCDLDCAYVAQLYRLPGKLLVTKRGRVTGGTPTTLPLRVPKAVASYRVRLSASATINPGKATTLRVNVGHG